MNNRKLHLMEPPPAGMAEVRRHSVKSVSRAAAQVIAIETMAREAGDLAGLPEPGRDNLARVERLLQAIHYQSQDLERLLGELHDTLHNLVLPAPRGE